MFRAYEKIHRIGKDEVEGILDVEVIIQEKVDGANASVWMNEGVLNCGSRTRNLTQVGDGFNGFVEYATSHEGIKKYLEENPTHRMYGEWLVRHTISYNELNYKHFYLFDIHDGEKFLPQSYVQSVAEEYGIKYATIFGQGKFTVADIDEIAGKSELGVKGEGVVVKPIEPFINRFGNAVYAKYVTAEFKEDNAVMFGGNNKDSEYYGEQYIVNKYMTLARVQKICHKLESEVGKLDMKHIPRVMSMCYYDMITEDLWEAIKTVRKIDFNSLKRISDKKSKQIYQDILSGLLSVAYFKEDVSKMSE